MLTTTIHIDFFHEATKFVNKCLGTTQWKPL